MVRILLKFPEKIVDEPIISQVILTLKAPLNIITAYVNSKGGEVLVEVPEDKMETVVAAFRKHGVSVSLPKFIEVDETKCINCGACVALCPFEAITQQEDGSIIFNKEKCVGSTCGTCVDACPARAIRSVKQENTTLTNRHTIKSGQLRS
jgi:ferredoxin